MTLVGVGMFMSPRWKGYTVYPWREGRRFGGHREGGLGPEACDTVCEFYGGPGDGVGVAVESAGREDRKCAVKVIWFDFS